MNDREYRNPKVISFIALLGVVVSFAISIIATVWNREAISLLFLVGAFYCLSKVDFKGKGREYKQYLNEINNRECRNPKVISFIALLGVVVNFTMSVIATEQNRETTSLLFLVGAFYCLSKVDFKGKGREYKQCLNEINNRKYRNPKIISFIALLGVVVNFTMSVIATVQCRESTAIIFLAGALYCLSKVNLKCRKREYKMQQDINC